MYAVYAYVGVVWGVNGAAYMAVPWSLWDLDQTMVLSHIPMRPGKTHRLDSVK